AASDESQAAEENARNAPLSFSLDHLDPKHPYLTGRGLMEEAIATFGLGYCEKGSMAARIAIPIHDAAGQLVAYAGRWPGDPPEGTAKYKLPKGFRKSLELFNYHRAAKADPDRPLLIVEGFFDCIKIWQAGYQRVVAVMGSTLSEAQKQALLSLV